METLELIVRIIEALIWPITILILLFLFRLQIVKLIQRVKEISYKDLKLILQEAEETAKTIKPPKLLDQKILKIEPVTLEAFPSERISQIASISPHLAIIEAWLEIERALTEAALKFGFEATTFTQLRKVIEKLIKDNILERNVLDLFNYLRTIRNRAAHTHELDISISDSMRYVELALEFTKTINIATLASDIIHKDRA